MKALKFILDIFNPPTIEEQREDYISKNGYPEQTVFFADSRGRLGSIIGKQTLRKFIESDFAKQCSKDIKEKGYFKPSDYGYPIG